jgi:hypothetical protein
VLLDVIGLNLSRVGFGSLPLRCDLLNVATYGSLAMLVAIRRGSSLVSRRLKSRRKVMEWFSRKTSIAGVQIPNWMVVLGAVIVILIIYSSIH